MTCGLPKKLAIVESDIDFATQIKPLLERSCIKCHGVERPKGGLSMTSLEKLTIGGKTKEPSVVPGDHESSQLWRFASDLVEDLEMPPLDKRDKYPALSKEELELIADWIDSGAVWDE